jgi:hypothetical protein
MEPQTQWERLRACLAGVEPESKIHLTVQGGLILAGGTSRYNRMLGDAGYSTGTHFYFFPDDPGNPYGEYVGNFNMLRKVQLTVNLRPAIEVGLAYYSLSEPALMADKYSETPLGGQQIDRDSYVLQTLAASGVYAVAVYKPLFGRRPKPFSWSIGLGLGAVKFNYRLRTDLQITVLHDEYWVSSQESGNNYGYSKTSPSAVVYTQIECFLYRNLSLGLIADYVYGPSVQVPAFPEMGLPAQSLRFGNASVGFVLGTHF